MKMIPLPGERLDVFAERLHQYVVDTQQHQRTTFNDTPIEAFPLDTVAMIVARYWEVRDQVQGLVKQLRALGVNPNWCSMARITQLGGPLSDLIAGMFALATENETGEALGQRLRECRASALALVWFFDEMLTNEIKPAPRDGWEDD